MILFFFFWGGKKRKKKKEKEEGWEPLQRGMDSASSGRGGGVWNLGDEDREQIKARGERHGTVHAGGGR